LAFGQTSVQMCGCTAEVVWERVGSCASGRFTAGHPLSGLTLWAASYHLSGS